MGLFEWVINAAQGEQRLAVFALNMALTNLVMFLSPILGASLAELTGTAPVLVLAGLCLALGAALAGRALPNRPPAAAPPPAGAPAALGPGRAGR